MEKLRLNSDYLNLDNQRLKEYLAKAKDARELLYQGSGKGNDFIGWLDYIVNLSDEEITAIKSAAERIKKEATALIVVGIGGSYLGTKSAVEALLPYFDNEFKTKTGKGLKIYFAGQQMSSSYLAQLKKLVAEEEVFVNVISKSGTTTEPAVAFRIIRQLLKDKYGDEFSKHIIATTDMARGALKKYADDLAIPTFVIPDNVGGRYSVFTPVGLLPIAAMGIDIDELIAGARAAASELKTIDGKENPALLYAAIRNMLYGDGYKTEVLVNYEPALNYLSEWWKQLYGESEGKEHKGILPHAMSFTTDLHSLGQYLQEGERTLFETVIDVKKAHDTIEMVAEESDLDGLNYLAGKSILEINRTAMLATILAHTEGGVPNLVLELPEINPYQMGYLYYFFMLACGISGYMLEVNPFDQPGVEAYKKNMFALLGKDGYQELRKELERKL